MAAFYQTFTTARTTDADQVALLALLRSQDATAGFSVFGSVVTVKKNSTWTAPQIAFVQNAIDTAPALTPQSVAQGIVDQMTLYDKAFALALIDQINVVRAALPVPLAAITPTQALAAIRTKAGTL